MLYERSFGIERRLQTVLDLIRSGEYSTPRIADVVGVSIPTVSRDVTALRQRGHDIRAIKQSDGWRYVLSGNAKPRNGGSRILALGQRMTGVVASQKVVQL
jgi:predicted DNA-binding transcriptional regulator YafY